MFTLTTNLAIWMAAVVDESIHQSHSYSNSPSNTSYSRLATDRECLPALGWVSLPCQPEDKGESQGLFLPQVLPPTSGYGWQGGEGQGEGAPRSSSDRQGYSLGATIELSILLCKGGAPGV